MTTVADLKDLVLHNSSTKIELMKLIFWAQGMQSRHPEINKFMFDAQNPTQAEIWVQLAADYLRPNTTLIVTVPNQMQKVYWIKN